MAESKRKTTKRKVNLVSSHSDNERDDGPLILPSNEGSAVSELYDRDRDRVPSFMRYLPKQGQQLIEEDIYIPDVDWPGNLTFRAQASQ